MSEVQGGVTGHVQVCVVIPVHNPGPLLERCLASVFASDGVALTVVVVDDGSTDGFVESASAQWPSLVVRRGDGNLWWSASMNIGIQWARAGSFEFVLSLNHDCVVDPAAIARMVGQAAGRRVLVGAKLLQQQSMQRLIGVGIDFSSRGFLFNGADQVDHGQFDHRRSVDMIDGHAMLVPLCCLNEVGSFDEAAFPQYWGDVDLVLRARAAGWDVEVSPHARVWNESGSTGLALGRTASVADVRRLLTDRRSHVNLRETVRFGRRHQQFIPWRHLLRRYQPHALALLRFYSVGRGKRPE